MPVDPRIALGVQGGSPLAQGVQGFLGGFQQGQQARRQREQDALAAQQAAQAQELRGLQIEQAQEQLGAQRRGQQTRNEMARLHQALISPNPEEALRLIAQEDPNSFSGQLIANAPEGQAVNIVTAGLQDMAENLIVRETGVLPTPAAVERDIRELDGRLVEVTDDAVIELYAPPADGDYELKRVVIDGENRYAYISATQEPIITDLQAPEDVPLVDMREQTPTDLPRVTEGPDEGLIVISALPPTLQERIEGLDEDIGIASDQVIELQTLKDELAALDADQIQSGAVAEAGAVFRRLTGNQNRADAFRRNVDAFATEAAMAKLRGLGPMTDTELRVMRGVEEDPLASPEALERYFNARMKAALVTEAANEFQIRYMRTHGTTTDMRAATRAHLMEMDAQGAFSPQSGVDMSADEMAELEALRGAQ